MLLYTKNLRVMDYAPANFRFELIHLLKLHKLCKLFENEKIVETFVLNLYMGVV